MIDTLTHVRMLGLTQEVLNQHEARRVHQLFWSSVFPENAEGFFDLTRAGVKAAADGLRGENRPADVIGAAIEVERIAVGDEKEGLGPDGGKDLTRPALGS